MDKKITYLLTIIILLLGIAPVYASDNIVDFTKKGTITITLDANTTEDCTINYSYEGESGKINPATGGSLPYAIIAAGVLLAGGVYVATRKKNKLYNI